MTQSLSELSRAALADLGAVFAATPDNAADPLIEAILSSKRICLYGAGREGLALRGFAMRLFHMGRDAHVVADMTTEDGKPYRGVRQQVVKLGPARGDQVAVLSGIKPGEEVVTSGVFKLRNGVAVQVNNTVQPANSAAPSTEDR